MNNISEVCNHPYVVPRDCVNNFKLGSPSPNPDSQDIAIDTAIYVEFAKSGMNVVMASSTFENFLIQSCNSNNISTCENFSHGTVTTTPADNYVTYDFENDFAPNTWYRFKLNENLIEDDGFHIDPEKYLIKYVNGIEEEL